MDVHIYYHTQFCKDLKRLSKKYTSLKQDFSEFLDELLKNPCLGIDLGSGFHKVRMSISSKKKGKSGGARVITYLAKMSGDGMHEIYLLTMYDKNEMENVSDKYLRHLIGTIDMA